MQRTTKALDRLAREWDHAASAIDSLHISYPSNELICQRGSYVAGIQLVLSGVVSESAALPGGLELLGPGDLIGLEVLAEGFHERSTSACLAITDVELLFFERRAFEHLLAREAGLAGLVLRYLASRHTRAREHVGRTLSQTETVCQLILRLDELRGGDSEPGDNAVLPSAITPKTLRDLASLDARAFREAWDAIDSLRVEDSRITFCREVLRRLLQGSPEAQTLD